MVIKSLNKKMGNKIFKLKTLNCNKVVKIKTLSGNKVVKKIVIKTLN